MKSLPEEFVRLEHAGEFMAGVLHLPDGDARSPGVLMCHGFTGTKVEAHRIFVKTARRLAAAGVAALRFDFRGSGDSQGEFQETTVTRQVEEAAAALRFLAEHPRIDAERLAILGLSLGGVVALHLAARDRRVRGLALWATPSNPYRIFVEQRGEAGAETIATHGYLDEGGNLVGRAFFDDLAEVQLPKIIPRCPQPILLVHGTGDAVVPVRDAWELEETFKRQGNDVTLKVVKNASHVFDLHPWEEEVLTTTTTWLRQLLLKVPSRSSTP